MQRFKTPKKSLFDHLTHDNYFLNERYNESMRLYNESVKMIEILRMDVDYMNKFIFSTYDLSSNNYYPYLKIVSYDSSDNVITYICTDSSGNLTSSIQLGEHFKKRPHNDVSNNINVTDMSRCFPYDYPFYHSPHHYHRRYRYRDIDEDRGITSKPTKVTHTTTVNGVVTHTDEEPRCLPPYYGYPYGVYPYPGYPYGGYPYLEYPYDILDDDYDNRNVTMDHPYHPPPQYPIVNPPSHPPIIHRDLIDHSLMHKQIELDRLSNEFSRSRPYHRYTTSSRNGARESGVYGTYGKERSTEPYK
jgi:hypothetical protein